MIPTVIRETRLATGWTQKVLAARAGTSQATLSRLEAGHIDRADLATIGRLLDALQVRAEIKLEAHFLPIGGGNAIAPMRTALRISRGG